jgi:hypothetical protein
MDKRHVIYSLLQTLHFEHEAGDVSFRLTKEKFEFCLKFNLVPNILIFFNCTRNFLSTFNFMQFYPFQTQLPTSKFSGFSYSILGFLFMQIDLQSIICLSIFFNLILDFVDFNSWSHIPFTNLSLVWTSIVKPLINH